jgi:hypothetical protein
MQLIKFLSQVLIQEKTDEKDAEQTEFNDDETPLLWEVFFFFLF